MKSKTYYGEYSLMHWIRLLVSKNLILPDYQRSFVWGEKDIKRLIKSLEDGQFVQPVTIAHFNDGTRDINYILDGQQRLTSLLLAFAGYMPNKTRFDSPTHIATEDDSSKDETEAVTNREIIGWTFQDILSDNPTENSIDEIKRRLNEDDRYSRLSIRTTKPLNTFLEETFLGFSYIVPEPADTTQYQRFFSTLFRNINYLGMKLSSIESRRSLYYMNQDYKNYFDGKTTKGKDVLCNLLITENMQRCQLDFVRYLAILSQYDLTSNEQKVMVGYSAYSARESFYADYVSYILGLEQAERPTKFDGFNFANTFGENGWETRANSLREHITGLKAVIGMDKTIASFTSWIEADYWLFGLIYWIIIKGKTIEQSPKLIERIKAEIESKRKDDYYSKNPNRLGNLRNRIKSSIKIYSTYAK